MFANECVGELAYESTAPAIAMAAAMITFILDFLGSRIAHRKYSGHTLGSPSPSLEHGESGSVEGKRRQADAGEHHPAHHDSHGHNFDAALAAEQNHQVLLLEAGIIFHSIMIGVTLVSLPLLFDNDSVSDCVFRVQGPVQDGQHYSSLSYFTRCLRGWRK